MKHVLKLIDSRELLWMWTLREIRVRYKQSLLGIAWAVLQPFSLMVVFTVVFSRLVRVETGGIPYPLFSYTALLAWTFLSTSITLGVPSLVNNMNLVTKVSMPREILPIAPVLASLLDLAVAAILYVGMLIAYRVALVWTAAWVFPLLLIQLVLNLAVVIFGSALNVVYRDVRFIVPLATQIWMYATPIIYPIELIPERFRLIYYLNPMAPVIDGYRRVILRGLPPDFMGIGVALAISVALLVVAYYLFKRMEFAFADVI